MVMWCSDEVNRACTYEHAHRLNTCTLQCTTGFVFNFDASASQSSTIGTYMRNCVGKRDNKKTQRICTFGEKMRCRIERKRSRSIFYGRQSRSVPEFGFDQPAAMHQRPDYEPHAAKQQKQVLVHYLLSFHQKKISRRDTDIKEERMT